MVSREKIAGIMTLVALVVPWFIVAGNNVSFAWTLFGLLSYSQALSFSFLTQWTLVEAVLSALCFGFLVAGAVMFFVSRPRLGSTLVLSAVLASVINIVFIELVTSSGSAVLIVPIGLLIATINVVQGFRLPLRNVKIENKKILSAILITIVAFSGAITLFQSANAQSIDASTNLPQFCTRDFVQLDKFSEISVFRSFEGHDYSDGIEHNLSMKHYFTPKSNATDIQVYSPADGTITDIFAEQNGVNFQVQIQVAKYSDYTVVIFHVNVTSDLKVGDKVEAGQQIGTLDVNQGTDIAVWHLGIFRDRLVSYFAVMTDEVFAGYQAHGIADRNVMIRTAAEAQTLSATYSFSNPAPDDWVILNSS